LPEGSTPIRPITGRRSLSPRSFTRRPVGGPHGPLSPHGESDGLTTFRISDFVGRVEPLCRWLLHLRRATSGRPHLATYLFGPSLSAPLACSVLRQQRPFTWVDPSTISWPPTALVLAVTASARAWAVPFQRGIRCPAGSRTPPLPATHAAVGDSWQNKRLRPSFRWCNCH